MGITSKNLSSFSRQRWHDVDPVPRLERQAAEGNAGLAGIAAGSDLVFNQQVDDHRGFDLVRYLTKQDFRALRPSSAPAGCEKLLAFRPPPFRGLDAGNPWHRGGRFRRI